jgi:hypothetical protein
MFLQSIDASNQVKDVKLLFNLLGNAVIVGVENVVQVISENASMFLQERCWRRNATLFSGL